MTITQWPRMGMGGLVALLALVCWTFEPARAQAPPPPDRGNLVVTSPAQTVSSASPVTYSISVKNDSTVTVTGMSVTMNLPGGVQFVNCTRLPTGQLCQASAGVITTTYPTIAAHATVTFRLLANMPAVSQNTSLGIDVLAHADKAINGEGPRDGRLTIATTVLPPTTRLQLLPSGRIVPVGCGFTLDAATFGPDTEGQLLDTLQCITGSGVTITASGKTLNLGSAKICSSSASSGSSCTSPARVKGNAGIIIGPNAANVTIMGGGTAGGVQQLEYCL